jgi:hypothetical protein
MDVLHILPSRSLGIEYQISLCDGMEQRPRQGFHLTETDRYRRVQTRLTRSELTKHCG